MKNFREEELLEIVAKKARKYTSNESTSISYQTARKLMSSTLYCMNESNEHINIEGKENTLLSIERKSALKAYEEGKKRKENKIIKAKELWEEIKLTFDAYQNECYKETIIDGMKAFFEWYDLEFDALNHIITLDYPLLCEVRNKKGIDLIYEYLRRTHLEQRFLNGFEKNEIMKLLQAYHKEYEGLIINITKLVLQNALGRILAGRYADELNIDEVDRTFIKGKLESKSKEEIIGILENALYQLVKEKDDNQNFFIEYLKQVIPDIAYEIKEKINNVEYLFLETDITRNQEPFINNSIYIEGNNMEDEELRNIIAVMSELEVESRIALIKEKVRSLSDLKELLKECFYGEEYYLVFNLLRKEEKDVLIDEIKLKLKFEEDLEEWKKRLLS